MIVRINLRPPMNEWMNKCSTFHKGLRLSNEKEQILVHVTWKNLSKSYAEQEGQPQRGDCYRVLIPQRSAQQNWALKTAAWPACLCMSDGKGADSTATWFSVPMASPCPTATTQHPP